MSRYKPNTTTQPIIIAVIVILLCLVSLSGATYALFTSTNDGTIGIVTTSGNVDIDIVDTAGVSLVDRTLAFVTPSDPDGLVEDVLFEPGAIFYTQGFKIENEGNIPVKFSLSISKDDGIDMEAFNRAFEIWLVREDDFDNAERLTNFRGELAPEKCSVTYYLFIKMKENSGNEFQGKTYTGIGITVYAVQGNANIGE